MHYTFIVSKNTENGAGSGSVFQLGDWTVRPRLNQLSRDGKNVEVEPKSMAVLEHLAAHPGAVVSSDEFIEAVWQGRPMGDNPVHRCVSRLRQALGDDARNPEYIATVQRKGYRLVAPVRPIADAAPAGIERVTSGSGARILTVIVLLATTLGAALLWLRPDAGDPRPAVAVMAFESLSDDPYLARGVSEDIRSMLARVDGLSVASRGASIQFPAGTDPQYVADKLAVSWILEGTARADNGRIRVTAQLIDARTRFEEWSDSFEGVMADLFTIQDRIAQATANAVVASLPTEWRLTVRGTDVIGAYEEFLRGEAALDRPHDDESLADAERHYRVALEHDPGYARAYAGLCRTFVAAYAFTDATDYVGRAEQACSSALSLDATLSEVPAVLGRLYRRQGRLDEAQAEFERALAINANSIDSLTGLAQTLADRGEDDDAMAVFEQAINAQPNDWVIYNRFGRYYLNRGRYADAARMYRRTVELRTPHTATFNNLGAALYLMGDFEMAAKAFEESMRIRPNRSARSNLGTMYYFLGNYEQAIASYRAAIELRPQDFVMWGNLGDALFRRESTAPEALSAYEKAIELAERQLEINPNDAATLAMLGSYRAHTGSYQAAARLVDTALRHAPDDPYTHYYSAVVAVLAGQKDKAMAELQQAVALGYPTALVGVDPEFVSLRSEAGYRQLATN